MTPETARWIDRWPLAMAAVAVAIIVWAAIPEPPPPRIPPPAMSELVGKWIRDDGTKTLEITSVREDGAVTVGYFNPDPINVQSANANRTEEALTLKVVLYDEKVQGGGYKGSTYTLVLDPKTHVLQGTYFESSSRQTSPTSFVRAEEEKGEEAPGKKPAGNP